MPKPILPTVATLDEPDAGKAKGAFKTAIRIGGMGEAVAAALRPGRPLERGGPVTASAAEHRAMWTSR